MDYNKKKMHKTGYFHTKWHTHSIKQFIQQNNKTTKKIIKLTIGKFFV